MCIDHRATLSVIVVVIIIFCFFFRGGAGSGLPHGMWGPCSLLRFQTHCPMHWESGVLTTGPPGKSLGKILLIKKHSHSACLS